MSNAGVDVNPAEIDNRLYGQKTDHAFSFEENGPA